MFIILLFVIGCIVGIYEAFKPIEQQETTETINNIPYYVYNKLDILETQKTINNDIIKELENELQYTVKTMEILKLEKKINDLDIKNNKIDQDIEKLKEKYSI